MNARVWLAGLLMAVLPSIVLAQGRIAVVNLEQAILQTDVAQQRLEEFETNEDFASDKSQFDALRAELDQLVKDFQRDQAAMSEEDQVAARQKMASKQSDLEYVAKNTNAADPECAARDAGIGAAGTRGVARDH
ncbi:MAG: OmpH family outer membrane protein [Luminiphilus sp.]